MSPCRQETEEEADEKETLLELCPSFFLQLKVFKGTGKEESALRQNT